MQHKNIWIIHHYADPPDGHWTGTHDLYKLLVPKGYNVTVFSSSFSHYTRKEERLKPHEKIREQTYDGVRYVFLKTPPYYKNDFLRFWNMFVYGVRSFLYGRKQKEKPDLIITATPHPFCAYAAYRLSKKFKAPLILELHDLWLDYLLDTKMTSSKNPAYSIIKHLETSCYHHAKYIFALWPKMNIYLNKYGVDQSKVKWIPLGLDFDTLESIPPKIQPSEKEFVVACTARFGPASNVEEILRAAKILKERGQDKFRFVFYGGGPEKENLERFKNENNLDKVEFRGMIPKEQIRGRLAEADACIAGLPDIDNYRLYGTIPTKILDYLTSNRPTIFITSIDDSLVSKARAGVVVKPNQPEKLADAIQSLSDLPHTERLKMGENGMLYMRENHDLKKLASQIDQLIGQI